MKHVRYEPPVGGLIGLGDPKGDDEAEGSSERQPWADYAALGLGAAHVDELIRMATDARFFNAADPDWWAPIHAWRALGQLRAASAAEPLVGLLNRHSRLDHDWGLEEIPEVLAMIGPPGVPALRRGLFDARNGLWAREGAARALASIVTDHPGERPGVVAALTEQLGRAAYNDDLLNGSLISSLIDLKAVEAEGAIRRAYELDAVDEQFVGTLDSVLDELPRGGPSEEQMAEVRAKWEAWGKEKGE